MSTILRSGDWVIEGRYWRNVRTGQRLPIIQGGGPAVSNQYSFWFRNDDGSLTGATYMGSQGDDQTLEPGVKFRLRFLVQETGGGNFVFNPSLRYSLNSGTYTDVTTSSNVIKFIDDDNSIANDSVISSGDLSGGSGTWVNGRYSDTGTVTAITLNSQHTEVEFCLVIVDADVSNNDTIDIQARDAGTALDSYTDIPRITVSKSANVEVTVPTGTLTLTGYAPTVVATAHKNITVPTGTLVLTGYAPTVAVTENVNITVPTGALQVTGYAPTVAVTENVNIIVPTGSLILTGYAPTVEVSGEEAPAVSDLAMLGVG